MALPSGRREAGDADLAATARREARQEVGLQLPTPVGRLGRHRRARVRVTVATFVFTLDRSPAVVPHPAEVHAAVWVPVAHLASRAAATSNWYRGMGPFPAIRYGDSTIWGLTHRIVTGFLRLLDR